MSSNSTQLAMLSNVKLIKHNGSAIECINAKNTVTSLGLTCIMKMLSGEFTDVTADTINNYIPNYVAIGNLSNSYTTESVYTTSPLDRNLLNEYKNGLNVDRIMITQKNFEFETGEVAATLELKSYIMSDQLVNYDVRELGLFTDKTSNTCWARVILPQNAMFTKADGEIIDIVWKICLAIV